MKKLIQLVVVCIFLISILGTGAVAASYPKKDIRMIIPWGAGGGTDGIVRKLSVIAEKKLGKSIYVENIEGGISATGVLQIMKARPNGYTIGALTYDSVITVPWQGLLPSYKLNKLKFISRVTSEPDAVIVSTKSPYKNISELIEAAKQKPGKIKVGLQNAGSRLHLAMLQFQKLSGTKFKLIFYPGGTAPQKEAILSREVDVVVTSLSDFSSIIESGDARGLVSFSAERNQTFPDVPTGKEVGIDLQMGSFIIIVAPANIPDEAVTKIENAYKEALESKEFNDWVAKVGVNPGWIGSKDIIQWIDKTKGSLFSEMQDLVDQGVLNK